MKELNNKLNELIKSVEDLVKSNYGPKGMGLYSEKDNVQRKAKRTGVVHEDVGQNKAEQKYTPSIQGTFAEQAKREAKRDQQKSKQNPVKTYTKEELEAFSAKPPAKKEPIARSELSDGDPHDASDKAEKSIASLAANPIARGAVGGAVGGAISGAVGDMINSKMSKAIEPEPKDPLKKPPVSEAQRRAMRAAAAGDSTLSIPKSVGTKFSEADKGGKLPEKKDATKKAATPGGTINYSQLNKPKKTPEDQQATISYKPGENPKYTPPKVTPASTQPKRQESSPAASAARVAEQKRKEGLVPKKPKTADEVFRERNPNIRKSTSEVSELSKAEVLASITTEALTKSIRSRHSDVEITAMLKAAFDLGKIHRNVCLEWQNYQTINPAVVDLVRK